MIRLLIILLLGYPLFYIFPIIRNMGYEFGKYYFLLITLVTIFISFFNLSKDRYRITKISFFLIFPFVIFAFLILTNPIFQNILNSLIFTIFSVTIILSFKSFDLKQIQNLFLRFLTVFIVVTFILLFFNNFYGNYNRFNGPLLSGTVFSTYLIALYITSLNFIRKKSVKFLLFVIIGYFVIKSGTRSNLFFLIIIPFALPFFNYFRGKLVFIVLSTSLMFVYYIYGLLEKHLTFLSSNRYEDGKDYSFLTRFDLFKQLINKFYDSTFFEKLFGHGANFTRLYIEKMKGVDFMAHNEFITLILDFGIIGFSLIMYILYKIFRTNPKSATIVTLFLFSFLHNMFFDRYMMFLIIFNYIIFLQTHNKPIKQFAYG